MGGTVSEYQNLDVVVFTAVPVPLVRGLSLIGLPVDEPSALSASGLALQVSEQGGEVAQVIRWDPGPQSYVVWSAASPEANDFEVRAGQAYFVLAAVPSANGAWSVSAAPFLEPVPLTFVAGLNMVSVPFSATTSGYDAPGLADAVAQQGGEVAQIASWDPDRQGFELWSAASPAANVFTIAAGKGYFVLVAQPTAQPFAP